MRAAAILGPGNLSRQVAAFQRESGAQWTSLIEQADAVVIFGGDGTVHRHLQTLLELDVPLMVVPCGSGNDFARALGLRKPSDSVKAWQKFSAGGGHMRAVDLGLIEEISPEATAGEQTAATRQHYFCCVAGVGLDSQIALRANQLPKWIRAHGGYGISAPREFLRFEPLPISVSFNGNGQGKLRPTTLVAVANAPAYGGGMKIAPNAKLDDGQLDVCVVDAMGKLKLLALFPTVYLGRHLGVSEVQYQQTESVTIATENPLDVYADGEYVCRTPVRFNILPRALKVIVPGHSKRTPAVLNY